jgi:hypothetical protein
MFKRPGFVLACLFSLSACAAVEHRDNVLVDMFAWWNGAIQTEGAFTREAFGRYFTEDAEIIVNDVVLVHGLDAMAEHFRGIQQRTDFVEIVLPFEEGFREGDKIFTYHLIRARENGMDRLSHVMGYAIVEEGKLALVNFLSYPEPVEPGAP